MEKPDGFEELDVAELEKKTIYVAACYSGNLAKIEKTKMVFGFKGSFLV
ncbi:MAG: hypothetical protein ACTSYM_13715 [Candidatus Baldrarchaeia archaeon]